MAVTKKKTTLTPAQKGARTRKRNANAKTPVKRRRRRTTKPKGLLSEFSSVENRNAFGAQVSGALGGLGYLVYEDQVTIQNMTPERKALFATGGAFVLAVLGKKPNMAAGIMGAASYDFFKAKGLLNDPAYTQMERMNYADPLENVPMTLSDDAMMLAQSGQMSLADAMALSEEENYLPDYANTSTY